jgi:hypothetical protein
MKKLSGNFSSTNNFKYTVRISSLLLYCFIFNFQIGSQTANYVTNGGFEICKNCETGVSYKKPSFWDATDTLKFFGGLFGITISSYPVPLNNYTYQWPRHGNKYLLSTQYCNTCLFNTRGYPRNTLRETLMSGHTYCFSMYINLSNESSYAINSIGAFFSDSSSDTITECTIPLTYLIPQVKVTNFISDTLDWVEVHGTYIANGTERYLILGNFNNDLNTDTILVNATNLPQKFSSYLFDDVSCIDIDLPAYAGPDQSIIPGDSVFIGRQPDVGIDEACMWFKLPDTTAIDTVAGLWVKPTSTSTYAVRQEICGNVKWDTVVIYMNLSGLEKLNFISARLTIFPVPAADALELGFSNETPLAGFNRVVIYDQLGEIIKDEEINFKEGRARINTSYLKEGIYSLKLISAEEGMVSKRFLIKR